MARGQKERWINDIVSSINGEMCFDDISDIVHEGVSELISEIEDRVNDIKSTLNDYDTLQAISMIDDLSDDLY